MEAEQKSVKYYRWHFDNVPWQCGWCVWALGCQELY
jgi:hypothetical protein